MPCAASCGRCRRTRRPFRSFRRFEDIRVVKTDPIEFGPSMLPRLRIWFRIDGSRVHLEYIEPDPFDEAP